MRNPSLGITVTETVRSGLLIIMRGTACPTCGQSVAGGITAQAVAKSSGVSPSTLSRFLGGKSIDSDTLDRLYEWVQERMP